ncbi:Hypothetical predicted protein [Cloeon dipterum]|uniref:Uncharacterized protein n=1 Tax=Cloeon dipterum TaxID=197152 RepID=A0A8S1D558_9INSE|nr:Hypothetical predicted protein [Cloeon dipterum]
MGGPSKKPLTETQEINGTQKLKFEGIDLRNIGHRGVPLPNPRRVTMVQPFKFKGSNMDRRATGIFEAEAGAKSQGDSQIQAGNSKNDPPVHVNEEIALGFEVQTKQEKVNADEQNMELVSHTQFDAKAAKKKESRGFNYFIAHQLIAMPLETANRAVKFQDLRQAVAQAEKEEQTLRAEEKRLLESKAAIDFKENV